MQFAQVAKDTSCAATALYTRSIICPEWPFLDCSHSSHSISACFFLPIKRSEQIVCPEEAGNYFKWPGLLLFSTASPLGWGMYTRQRDAVYIERKVISTSLCWNTSQGPIGNQDPRAKSPLPHLPTGSRRIRSWILGLLLPRSIFVWRERYHGEKHLHHSHTRFKSYIKWVTTKTTI